MNAAKLDVMSINFLRSGALSIEVSAQSMQDAPAQACIDVVKMWVYVPSYDKSESMQSIIDKAIEIARQSLRSE